MPSTNVVGATQTASATGYFVGENKPKPLSALAFAALSLTPRKIAADIAATDELLRVANADAALLMERSAGKANAVTWDTALLDPANAGIANIKPASLLNGLVALTPSGDYANQVGQVFAAISDGAPANPVLILSLQSALRLMALRDLASIGVKVIVSPAAENRLIAVDADGVSYTDDGGDPRIGEPDLEMSDSPADPTVAGTVLTSTWQRNMKVVRSERWTSWAKRSDAVSYLELA